MESTRLRNLNYASNGHYFITICTKNKECYFGEIIDDKMILSKIGKIAHKYWQEIPKHFPFVRLDKFVIMPNHVHGIIIIDNHNVGTYGPIVETPNLGVSTVKTNVNTQNKYWKPGNLGVIINQYKRKCTIESRKMNPYFQWQPRFYDHVIRNKQDLNRIQQYIQNNPHN
jgi:REP element-mobilizing transposase RayT